MRDNEERLLKLNRYLTTIQYVNFMLIFSGVFIIVSVALIPVAWIVGSLDKIRAIDSASSS